jgi:hypothetical protein
VRLEQGPLGPLGQALLELMHREDCHFPKQIFQPGLTSPRRQQMRSLEIRSSVERSHNPIPKLQFQRNWRREALSRCA